MKKYIVLISMSCLAYSQLFAGTQFQICSYQTEEDLIRFCIDYPLNNAYLSINGTNYSLTEEQTKMKQSENTNNISVYSSGQGYGVMFNGASVALFKNSGVHKVLLCEENVRNGVCQIQGGFRK